MTDAIMLELLMLRKLISLFDKSVSLSINYNREFVLYCNTCKKGFDVDNRLINQQNKIIKMVDLLRECIIQIYEIIQYILYSETFFLNHYSMDKFIYLNSIQINKLSALIKKLHLCQKETNFTRLSIPTKDLNNFIYKTHHILSELRSSYMLLDLALNSKKK